MKKIQPTHFLWFKWRQPQRMKAHTETKKCLFLLLPPILILSVCEQHHCSLHNLAHTRIVQVLFQLLPRAMGETPRNGREIASYTWKYETKKDMICNCYSVRFAWNQYIPSHQTTNSCNCRDEIRKIIFWTQYIPSHQITKWRVTCERNAKTFYSYFTWESIPTLMSLAGTWCFSCSRYCIIFRTSARKKSVPTAAPTR